MKEETMSHEAKPALTTTTAILIPATKTERQTAKAHPNSKLVLVINNADNEVIAFVNADEVYDRKTEGDPTFTDTVDLSSKLRSGHNSIVILGINWGGPAHFIGNLSLDGKVLFNMTFALPTTPNGVVASWVADIVVS
jgi:hypothetical protein